MSNNIIIQFSELEFKELLINCVTEGIKASDYKTFKPTSDKLFTIKEASEFLNLAPQTLYGYTSTRKIPFIKKGKKLYFNKKDIEIWLAEGRQPTMDEIEAGISKGKNPGKL